MCCRVDDPDVSGLAQRNQLVTLVMARPRMMLVIGALARGGAERVASVLSYEWQRTHDVTLVVFDARKQSYRHGGTLVDLGVPSRRTRIMNAIGLLSRIVRLLVLIFRSRPGQIITFMESANVPVIVAAWFCGMASRTKVSVRNNPVSLRWRYRVLIPWLYRLPKCIVVPSAGIAHALIRRRLPPRKVVIIPNPSVEVACEHDRGVVPHTMQYILGVGRLVYQKQFELLIDAFSRLHAPGVCLVILGVGPQRRCLEDLASALGVGSRVLFRGVVSTIETWYQNAIGLVLTSRYEGWPNVLVEAMANGCPVISVNCRYGPSEILEDGRYGLLVPQGDADGLATAIGRVLSNPELRTRLAAEGMRRAKTFEAAKIARLWLA